MIVGKSPLRISLGGGGTDLPSYYRHHEGFVLAATIDKHVYVSLNSPFTDEFILKYSQSETVKTVDQIDHSIIRESIRHISPGLKRLEVQSVADIPSGTGLGSSGAFTTALVAALLELSGQKISSELLAQHACDIEIDLLNEPVGKQDQYAAAFGGINAFTFNRDDSVVVRPLAIEKEKTKILDNSLSLFFTGFTRSASSILKTQNQAAQSDDSKTIKFLDSIKEIGHSSEKAITSGDIDLLAELFLNHWQLKKNGLSGASNTDIDALYEVGINSGALAGKVVGAGGGGFLLFISKDKEKLNKGMASIGIHETPFNLTSKGTEVYRV